MKNCVVGGLIYAVVLPINGVMIRIFFRLKPPISCDIDRWDIKQPTTNMGYSGYEIMGT